MAKTVEVCKLKPGDRFSFIPAEWFGPSVVRKSYKSGNLSNFSIGVSIWTIKFANWKLVNPPGVWYGDSDTKVRLLPPLGKR